MTSFFLMQAKNEDAGKFIQILDMKNQFAENSKKDKSAPSVFSPEELKAVLDSSALGIESRYEAVSRVLKEGGYKNLLDIACGFTPRSLYCCRNGINYVGFDVPIVAETLSAHASELLPGLDHSPYVGGDATNMASLCAAADLLDGELMISCEGLLTYLSKDELVQLIEGVRTVLKKHGGAWYTDDYCVDYEKLSVAALKTEDAVEKYWATRKKSFDSSNIYNRVNGVSTKEDLTAFLKENGMLVEEIPYAAPGQSYEMLSSFSEEIREKLADVLHSCVMLKITADPDYREAPPIEGAKEIKNLRLHYSVHNGTLYLGVSGRIDTISAPVLLECFETNRKGVSSLQIDFSGVEYISSAGLRTLMIMRKALGERSIEISGLAPAVREIFETTGFLEFFRVSD